MAEGVFTGVRAGWRPLYEVLKARALAVLGPFDEAETAAAILWKRNVVFVDVRARKDAIVLAIVADRLHEEWTALKVTQPSANRVVHTFELTDEQAIDVLVHRMEKGYEIAGTARAPKRAPKTDYTTVDEYIDAFDPDVQEILRGFRAAIKAAAPDATERISWQMPTYTLGRVNLVGFAAAKKHVALFPAPEAIEAFADKLTGYATTKGGIQFPLNKPVPYELIGEITRWRRANPTP